MPDALQAVSIGVVVLLVVVSVPVLIGAQDDAEQTTVSLDEGETNVFGSAIDVTLTDAKTNKATLYITSQNTGNTTNTTISVGDTQILTLDNNSIQITLEETEDTLSIITLRYTAADFYSSEGQTIFDNFGLVLAALAFIVVVGLFAGMVRL